MADIELVIKIPRVEYEHLTNKEKFYSLEKSKQEWLINKTLNRVIDGTPLPKGHGKIIDESQITEVYTQTTEERYVHGQYTVFIVPRINIVGTDAPTIIEADKGE